MRRAFLSSTRWSIVGVTLLCGCGSSNDSADDASGGAGANGLAGNGSGGGLATGGGSSAGGSSSTGGSSSAGASSSGGDAGKASSGAGGTGNIPGPDGGRSGSAGSAGGGNTGRDGSVGACGRVLTAQPTPTDLVPGRWTNITPPVQTNGGGGALALAIDPNKPGVVYVGIEAKIGGDPGNGIWKSTNSGKSWVLLGQRPDPNPYDNATQYLDLPISMAVDPADSNHLYVTEGVRGANNGFWVSTDGGANWTRMPVPKGTTDDVALVATDPCDFNHILVSPHSAWADANGGAGNAGIMESKDAGKTWITHAPPNNPWAVGTKGVLFLHHPETGQGDDKTWLVTDNGFWRTSDAGVTWTKVSDGISPHGTNEFYYSANGDLFAGEAGHLERSTDNGLTWKAVANLPYQTYYALAGDGKQMFTMPDGYPPASGYWTSAESDGSKWALYSDTTKPARGPIRMRFDQVNRILYSTNWDAGVWALKLP